MESPVFGLDSLRADMDRLGSTAMRDVQNERPTVHVSLSRVGVTGVEKVIRISRDGREELYWAKLECFVDLGPKQKGAHMSRFEEVVNDAIGEVILNESAFRAETLAQHIAEKIRDRHGARRAGRSRRSAGARAAGGPLPRRGPPSKSRRRTAASSRRRSTRCTGSRWP